MHDYLCMHKMCVYVCTHGNRKSTSQPEHDLESDTTQQATKCVTWAQSFFISMKTEKQRNKEKKKASTNLLHSEAN